MSTPDQSSPRADALEARSQVCSERMSGAGATSSSISASERWPRSAPAFAAGLAVNELLCYAQLLLGRADLVPANWMLPFPLFPISLLFAFPGWLLVMHPLAMRVDPRGWTCRPSVAPVFGALLGCAVLAAEFIVLNAVTTGRFAFEDVVAILWQPLGPLWSQAAVIAGVSWSTFAWLLRRVQRGNDERSSRSRSEVM